MLLTLVLKNLWARRSRTWLTALGVGVSVAVIVAIFALATDLKKELGAGAELTQADLIATQRGLAGLTSGSIPDSSVEDVEAYEGVESATGFLVTSVRLPEMSSFNLLGASPEDSDLYLSDAQIVEGRRLENPAEVLLGKGARSNLGLQLGSLLELESGEEFRVAGVYSTGSAYLDGGGMISLAEAQEVAGREGKVTLVAIYLEPGADEEDVINRIESGQLFLSVAPPSRLLEALSSIEVVDTSAWVFYSIAVIMGGIGVVSTMSMSFWERMREIGILRAAGWSRFNVLKMILGESMLLSLAGFVIGSLLGVAAICLITSLPSVKGLISPAFSGYAFLLGLAVALLLGLLGGALPAYRACRLSPAEALCHE